jgi:hypothetical protein
MKQLLALAHLYSLLTEAAKGRSVDIRTFIHVVKFYLNVGKLYTSRAGFVKLPVITE